MLVISRKMGEKTYLRFGGVTIELLVVRTGLNLVKIGITAPKEVEVLREELLDAKSAAEAARSGRSES